MCVIASFNYTHSMPAVIVGATMALAVAVALIVTGRPWLAAAIGAVTWSAIGYGIGVSGQGDMAGLTGNLYAMLAALPGAIVAGVGAWVWTWQRRRTRGGRRSEAATGE